VEGVGVKKGSQSQTGTGVQNARKKPRWHWKKEGQETPGGDRRMGTARKVLTAQGGPSDLKKNSGEKTCTGQQQRPGRTRCCRAGGEGTLIWAPRWPGTSKPAEESGKQQSTVTTRPLAAKKELCATREGSAVIQKKEGGGPGWENKEKKGNPSIPETG